MTEPMSLQDRRAARLKIKPFHKDVDALVALGATLGVLLAPDPVWDQVVLRIDAYPFVFVPLMVAIAGRFGIRITGIRSF